MRWVPFFFLLFVGCAHVRPNDPIPPHETLSINSMVLGEKRVINVSLPPGYADGSTKFDVLYMPDGALDEDFPHIVNTVRELIARGEISPVIVVGIPNTVRRRDLTPPTVVETDREIAPVVGGSEKFRRFIRDELFPVIAAKYRVTERRSIIGESLAGLFVLETMLLAPEMFSGFIAFSPSLWWNDHALVRTADQHLGKWNERGGSLYFAVANENDIRPHTDALAELLTKTQPPGLVWKYAPKPAEQHQTIFRAAKEEGLRTVLGVHP
jgi:predicted alpha/beta superfamily hydrolase